MPTEPTEPREVRQALLRACADVLLVVEHLEQAALPVVESITASRCCVRIEVRLREESGGTNRTEKPPPGTDRLTPLDRLILAKLTRDPSTMEALAHRCGHENDRYFQKRVGRLIGLGHVLHDFHGYRLTR